MSAARTATALVPFLTLVLLSGCASTPGKLSIDSVSPAAAVIGEPARITIHGNGLVLPATGGEPQAAGVEVVVCGVALTDLEFGGLERQTVGVAPGGARAIYVAGSVSGVLPAGAVAGPSDVTVSLPLSGSASAQAAFACLEPEPRAVIATTPEPASGLAPLHVEFVATGSAAGSGGIETYEWDFGDGTTGEGGLVAHDYLEPGEYTATLVVTDSAGGRSEASVPVMVLAVPPDPTIAIEPASGELFTGESREFSATVQHLDDDGVTWSVTGVGKVDDPAANPVTFSSTVAGSATLTATSVANPGLSTSVALTVTASELSVSPVSVTLSPGESIELTASATGPVEQEYEWSASSGSLSATSGETVTYTAPLHAGTDTDITVTVTSPLAETGAETSVTVTSRLVARETGAPTSIRPYQLIADPEHPAWYALGVSPVGGGFGINSRKGTGVHFDPLGGLDTAVHGALRSDGMVVLAGGASDRENEETEQCFYPWQVGMGLSSNLCLDEIGDKVVDFRAFGEDANLMLLRNVNVDGFAPEGSFSLWRIMVQPNLWGAQYQLEPIFSADEPRLWVDGMGTALVAAMREGSVIVGRYSSESELIQPTVTHTFDVSGQPSLTALAADADGDIILAFSTGDTSLIPRTMQLRKFDGGTNAELWGVDLGATGEHGITGLLIDPDGTINVAGQSLDSGEESELFVAAFDPDGNRLWREQFSGGDGLELSASTELLAWDDDTMIVGGYTWSEDENPHVAVFKLRRN